MSKTRISNVIDLKKQSPEEISVQLPYEQDQEDDFLEDGVELPELFDPLDPIPGAYAHSAFALATGVANTKDFSLETPSLKIDIPQQLPELNLETGETGVYSKPPFNPQLTEVSSMISGLYQYPQSSSLIQNHFEEFATGLKRDEEAALNTSQYSRYQDLGILGKGGMGEVRRVLDRDLNRVIAMKIIHRKFTTQKSLMARFIEEAQTTAKLQHPNLVPILDFGALIDHRFFFTMPEIQGQTLRDVILKLHQASTDRQWGDVKDDQGEWNFRSLIQAFKTICDAVGYAHDHHVIHRDLKPENIMLGVHGEVLVLDWGIAKNIAQKPLSSPSDLEHQELAYQATKEPLNKEQEIPIPTKTINIGSPSQSVAYLVTQVLTEEDVNLKPSAYSQTSISTPSHSSSKQDSSLQRSMDPYGSSLSSPQKSRADLLNTQAGAVVGTLSYMAPEQLAGKQEEISYESDVYCLGGILYEILNGIAPFPIKKSQFDFAKADEERKSLRWRALTMIPQALKDITKKALAYDKHQRYANANLLANEIEAWLSGSKQREKAFEYVAKARYLDELACHLIGESQTLEKESLELFKTIKPWSAEKDKIPYWQKQKESKEAKEKADLHMFEAEQALQVALLHDPFLEDAHLGLILRQIEKHKTSEKLKHDSECKRYELYIRDKLPFVSPEYQLKIEKYLNPFVSVEVNINTSDCCVIRLYSAQLEYKRLVNHRQSTVFQGNTFQSQLKIGTHILEIEVEGCDTLIYPMEVKRETGFNDIHPISKQKQILTPIPKGLVPSDMKYVPAGWFICGGDQANVSNAPTQRRLWLDGYFIKQTHISHAEYLIFINDLVKDGRKEEAIQWAPKNKNQELQYRFNEDTQAFEIESRLEIEPHYPVNYVNYQSAVAYCEWLSDQWGIRVRLPMDCEWEKAARGVDGRYFPWGDEFNYTWCRMRQSQEHNPSPANDMDYPIDQSAYGVMGLAGNLRDWCYDTFETEFRYDHGCIVDHQDLPQIKSKDFNPQVSKVVRGGSWKSFEGNCRLAFRYVASATFSDDDGSFRVAFSLADLERAKGLKLS